MRITVRHHQPYPLTWAFVQGPGLSDRAAGRLAARAALTGRHRPAAGVATSLSHRAGRGAAVVAPATLRVGIDLERSGSIPPERERLFATAGERRCIGRLGDATVLWSLKEAAWKAFGCPADLPFTDLALELDERGAVRGARIGDRRHAARSSVVRPWPGFILALVWAEVGA